MEADLFSGGGRILVPLDFSDNSASALRWAVRMARLSRAELHLLHVVHDPAAAPGSYRPSTTAGSMLTLEERAREMMTAFLRDASQRHPDLEELEQLPQHFTVGLPASRIVEVAEQLGAQLIVMGSTGRTALSGLLLGSKANRVVRLSPVPVTIVKPDPPRAPDGHADLDQPATS